MPAANHSRTNSLLKCTSVRFARAVAVVCLYPAVLAGCTATDTNHPLRGAASTVGFATTVGEPKDFVKASRGTSELAYVPIGRGGVERPITPRNIAGVKDLETELDRTRDQSDGFARRQLPRGAYGRALPSLAAPPRKVNARAGTTDQPTSGAPESYPVNQDRLRQIRENSRQTTQ